MKKKQNGQDSTQKRKKQKTTKTEEKSQEVKAELLDFKSFKEGSLLLGCVTEVRFNCAQVSLPGCAVGTVPFSNVSRTFNEELKGSTQDDAGVSLDSVITLGAVYPCKVMEIASKENLNKPIITLSIDPKDVNEDLRPNSLYSKMVVYGAVESIEDHGYVIDLGVKGVQGFLPYSLHCDNSTLTKGQVVATVVKKLPKAKSGNVVTLSYLSFSEAYPEVEDETLKLSSIMPGTHLVAEVVKIKQPFYYMKFSSFDVCANVSCLSSSAKTLTEGMKVSGTVLYVHPVTHMIYLFLGSVPTPQTFEKFFAVKKHDLLKKVKFEFKWHNKLFFKINKGPMGYVWKKEIPEMGDFSQESLLTTPVVPKARAVYLYYLDNLVQLSFKESVINQVFLKPEEVKIGDILEATVKNHNEKGMFVKICPGLNGFVPKVFMSDVLLTMPEKLFKPDSKVKCRVICKKPPASINLTCKDSLINIPESELLKSYEDALEGQSYKGVIVQKADTHILVVFFNGVKGIIPIEEVPKSSLLYVGHTISCSVTHCEAVKQKLRLSMITNKNSGSKGLSLQNKPLSADDLALIEKFEPKKLHKAVITKVTAHQLNLVINKEFKGRVHISEIGVAEEDTLPLREFTTGMKLKVHVIGQCDKRTHNFLPISHRITKNFLECSLTYPPPVPIERTLRPGMQVTGFVKEVYNTHATLWLSPICVGTLEFVNFSENAKLLRKLQKKLRVGLSLNVTVLQILGKQNWSKKLTNIMLTRLGNKPLQPGTNVVGFVERATLESGMNLKLPQGYTGHVGLTDFQDSWAPLDSLMTRCLRLKFVICHLVEVDHSKKTCVVTLRKSRLYGQTPESPTPEVTPETLKQGRLYSAYVSKYSDGQLTVEFGRSLVGRVQTHSCAMLNCTLCKSLQSVLGKFAPGSVVQVKVEGEESKGIYPVLLPELEDVEIFKPSRLKISEDIDWDEV